MDWKERHEDARRRDKRARKREQLRRSMPVVPLTPEQREAHPPTLPGDPRLN